MKLIPAISYTCTFLVLIALYIIPLTDSSEQNDDAYGQITDILQACQFQTYNETTGSFIFVCPAVMQLP